MKRDKIKYAELFIFLSFTLVAILPFCFVKYVPSLDGPQHLYTSRLIAELIKGNDFIGQFFTFSPLLVGNLGSQYLMAILMLVFPAWLAEKIFLSFYIIGLALSFRYFIKSIFNNSSLLYLLIFPFAYTSLFMLGYYNFSIAFIPLFLALGYQKRHETSLGIRQTVLLALFSLLIYLSHAVVFVFFGLIIFLQMIFELAYSSIFTTDKINSWKTLAKKYLIILASAIPAIFLWLQYYFYLKTIPENITPVAYNPISGLLTDLYSLRILIGFHHGLESGSNTLLFYLLVALSLLIIIPLHRIFPGRFTWQKVNSAERSKWTFILLVLFGLTLFFPDKLVTASMSVRLSILFFFGLIIWISIQAFPKKVIIIALFVIFAAFTWHRVIIYRFHKNLNTEIADLEDAGKFIKPQSIIFPLNCSENWLQPHFHCYLGVDKPIIDVWNPQANGIMPLIWNYEKMPDIILGELNKQAFGAHWVSGNDKLTPVPADYIFIWRSQKMDKDEGVTSMYEKLIPYYEQTFRSENGNALLLQLENFSVFSSRGLR